jgi:uncharacterized RmlC-like cupin family protein
MIVMFVKYIIYAQARSNETIGSPKMCVEIFTLARGSRACIESTQFIIMSLS